MNVDEYTERARVDAIWGIRMHIVCVIITSVLAVMVIIIFLQCGIGRIGTAIAVALLPILTNLVAARIHLARLRRQ